MSAELRIDGATLVLDDVALDGLARQVAELLAERAATRPEPWIGVQGAADHLAAPPSRVYALVSANRIPHRRDGSRLLFRRSELDQWVERGGARRP